MARNIAGSTPRILGQFAHLIDPGKLESGL